jgi:hypothetical protein
LGGLTTLHMSTDVFPNITIPVTSVVWVYSGQIVLIALRRPYTFVVMSILIVVHPRNLSSRRDSPLSALRDQSRTAALSTMSFRKPVPVPRSIS